MILGHDKGGLVGIAVIKRAGKTAAVQSWPDWHRTSRLAFIIRGKAIFACCSAPSSGCTTGTHRKGHSRPRINGLGG